MGNKLKIINDPVYGFIKIPSEKIYHLVQSQQMQRLRRIKQLGLSNLVYPGAEHTRFSHSIGAMFLMTKALDGLRQKGYNITDDEYEATVEAILLHDVGHSPFSHCLEHIFFNCHHEDISKLIMKELGCNENAVQIFDNTYKKKFLHQLVSSQVDIDRLDYLTRDSFFTGVSEGVIGTDRIMNMFSIHNDELVIDQKGVYSIEKFIISRRLMYWQVYMHKTVVGADCLLRNILYRAKELALNNDLKTELFPISQNLYYFLVNPVQDFPDKESLNKFLLLDDTDIWSAVKTWSVHKDRILSFLSQSLITRNVGHMHVKNVEYSGEELQQYLSVLKQRHHALGLSEDELKKYFLTTGQMFNRAYSFNDQQINIMFKDKTVKGIHEASDQLDENFLNKEIKKYYFHEI
ncbi:MAG: HD domain-containing protein [Bacteroidales bacterium]|nr:HD domain-containing protein [Bacteroidales bacterium]